MSELIQSFTGFLGTLDLSKMIITLIISNSVADLVKVLIQQFVQPFSERAIIDAEKEVVVAGQKIDVVTIINRTLAVLVSITVAFMIYTATE